MIGFGLINNQRKNVTCALITDFHAIITYYCAEEVWLKYIGWGALLQSDANVTNIWNNLWLEFTYFCISTSTRNQMMKCVIKRKTIDKCNVVFKADFLNKRTISFVLTIYIFTPLVTERWKIFFSLLHI